MLPDFGFLREPKVLEVYPVSRAQLWKQIKSGDFPPPVKLSANIAAWPVNVLRAHFDSIEAAQAK